MIDELDPYNEPSGNGFFGIPRMGPSFGAGSWKEGALQLDGQGKVIGGVRIQQASFSEAAPEVAMSERAGTVSFEDAIEMLVEDKSALNASSQEGQDSRVLEAINHPDAAQMFQNLQSHGVTSLKAEITPDMNAEERATELLLAGQEATQEVGIPMPEEQR